MSNNGRRFQERLDGNLAQAMLNVCANSVSEKQLLMAILAEIMDVRFELQEFRAERAAEKLAAKEKQRKTMERLQRELWGR